jgi:GAF domain-containing protein
MKDLFAVGAAKHGDDDAIRTILSEVCRITQMGFAAVARVTEARWVACQVEDRIELGLKPGDELEIKKTICNDIRECGRAIIIDNVGAHPDWRTHPIPMLYGFESYASLPVTLADGSFYGTLCAIDPKPRMLNAPETIAALQQFAREVSAILSRSVHPSLSPASAFRG